MMKKAPPVLLRNRMASHTGFLRPRQTFSPWALREKREGAVFRGGPGGGRMHPWPLLSSNTGASVWPSPLSLVPCWPHAKTASSARAGLEPRPSTAEEGCEKSPTRWFDGLLPLLLTCPGPCLAGQCRSPGL